MAKPCFLMVSCYRMVFGKLLRLSVVVIISWSLGIVSCFFSQGFWEDDVPFCIGGIR